MTSHYNRLRVLRRDVLVLVSIVALVGMTYSIDFMTKIRLL